MRGEPITNDMVNELITNDTEWYTLVDRQKPKKLPRFELGQKVCFDKTVDGVYVNDKEKKLVYETAVNLLIKNTEGIVVGVTFICEGDYYPGSGGSGFEWDEPEPPVFIFKRRHMVYLVKKTLRGCTYKVLPEDLKAVGDTNVPM